MPEVRLLGGELRRALGGRSLRVPAARLRDVLAGLASRGGPDVARRIFRDPLAKDPLPHPDLRLLVNGRNARFLDDLDTPLAESDAVTVHFAGARSYPGG